jgi:hypothetical protein
VQEPGLDLSEWESEWEALQDQLADSPREALSELDDLVARMLNARGYAIDDEVASEGDDPEILREFLAARDVNRMVESGNDVDPGDIASAVNGYTALYQHVIAERAAP